MSGELRYDGRVAIVTGAGGGLGRSHAMLLASRGASVVVNDLGGNVDGSGDGSMSPAEYVVKEIIDAGGKAVADGNTVSTCEGGKDIVQTALDHFGKVDIVINNAGILRDKSFSKMTPELLNPVLDVHLQGSFWTTLAAWEQMKEQNFGRIINTTSSAGLFGNFGQANYAAAKTGVIGLTNVLAIEGEKYNIKANVIAPGALTRMTEDLLAAFTGGDIDMSPGQVSPVVAYLCHENCPTSGEIFSASGGRVARVLSGACVGYEDKDLTIEKVSENFDEVRCEKGYIVPGNATEEVGLMMLSMQKFS